ncbi:MAG: hypothetical protein LUQ42_00345 [Methanomicrobiales archaeon]|nr:hypothetical protein [Methanomicrobiales archaeon]MDD1647713.1 hypothetical protein [Methanomicrobiales archaeon]
MEAAIFVYCGSGTSPYRSILFGSGQRREEKPPSESPPKVMYFQGFSWS